MTSKALCLVLCRISNTPVLQIGFSLGCRSSVRACNQTDFLFISCCTVRYTFTQNDFFLKIFPAHQQFSVSDMYIYSDKKISFAQNQLIFLNLQALMKFTKCFWTTTLRGASCSWDSRIFFLTPLSLFPCSYSPSVWSLVRNTSQNIVSRIFIFNTTQTVWYIV